MILVQNIKIERGESGILSRKGMYSWLKFLYLFICLSIYNSVSAQSIAHINDSTDEHILTGRDQMYLEDRADTFTINQVANTLYNKFKINYLFAPHNKNRSSAYWIRVRIKENNLSRKEWILEFFDQTIDHIEAYIPNDDGTYNRIIMGDELPFRERVFHHKDFELKIPNKSNAIKEYYFKIKAPHRVNIIIVLRSIEKLFYYALNEYFVFGLFYGMILVVSIYNLLMYFAVREAQYLVYVLYILTVGIYTASADGIAFEYLWPANPDWNNLATGISLYCLILWALVFTRMFLQTYSNYPKLDMLIGITIIIRTLIFVIGFLFYHELLEYRWIEFLPLSIAFISSIYAYVKGFKAARLALLAYALLFIAFIIKVIINLDLGFIPGTILTNYSINVSLWIEMVLLTFALGDKVRILKDVKDKALQEIIRQHEINLNLTVEVKRDLEEQVQNRTKEILQQKLIISNQFEEIKIANEKLVEKSEEITKINAGLDLDNYKLQRTVKEEMLARVGNKSLEYEEFKKIFPDELACLRYLEKKWENGFVCKKCEHNKSLSGKSKFDRRCSRCGYNESPTAFTIFQNVKFPLEKAFYILHLVISDRDEITIDVLSRTLGLRRNTCWAFKDKVSKIIKNNKPKKGHLNWETVVFRIDFEEDHKHTPHHD